MKSRKTTDRHFICFSLVLLLLTGFSGITFGESEQNDIAIKGYDTVAYFMVGKALKGKQG